MVKDFNKKNEFQIKPILGNEIYVVDDEQAHLKAEGHFTGRIYGHLILLAKNKDGYRQIRELSKIAWTNMFKRYKVTTTPVNYSDLKRIIKKGDVICSTACLGSLFAKYIAKFFDANEEKDREEMAIYGKKIKDYIRDYKEIFGDDFYIELQPNKPDTLQWKYNKMAVLLAEKYNLPYIITTDSHYNRPEDAKAHEILLKSDKNDSDREVQEFYAYTYFMGASELHALMDKNIGADKVELALDTCNKMTKEIEVIDMYMPTQMPIVDLPDNIISNKMFDTYCGNNWEQYSGIKFFRDSADKYNQVVYHLTENGFKNKIVNHSVKSKSLLEYLRQINLNLEVLQYFEEVEKLNYSQYFLVTKKIVDLIWDAGSFVGIARGSAGAFIINYLMDIVDVDAVESKFPYWRFLAKGRKDDPDYRVFIIYYQL